MPAALSMRTLSPALLFHVGLWDACFAISVEELKKHKQGDMDEDEFLWNKLKGRCCFELRETCPFQDSPRELCTKSSPQSCKECSVWSEPDNYCHLSKENCLSCGMQLYCPRPPPLLDGNKVCTKSSRVGEGCFDTRGTGLCAATDFTDCEDACRAKSTCQLFVYYPEEMKGSCVLCRDLFSFEHTTDAATRAYAVTASSPPPGPVFAQPRKYSFVHDTPPPVYPITSPPPPPTTLGHHRIPGGHEHTECTYDEGVEYTVDRTDGYFPSKAPSREECCSLCGHTAGCTDFVFEPSTSTCVLLPHITSESEIEAWPNPDVVSGSVKISLAPIVIPSSSCSFSESTGYARGSLGTGKPVPGTLMLTKEDCCLACGAVPLCAKFTFEPGTKTCTLHEAYAEVIKMEDMLSGMVKSKLVGQGEIFERYHGGENASEAWRAYPPPPMRPGFAAFETAFLSPPPPLSHEDGGTTEMIISRVSSTIFMIMVFGVFVCTYCFFSPQILRMAYDLSGGKFGKRLEPKHKRIPAMEPASETGGHKRSKGRCAGMPPKLAWVTLETKSMTQRLELDVSDCYDLASLRTLFRRSFGAILKGVRPSETTIFCLASCAAAESGDEGDHEEEEFMWCLITGQSDFTRVLRCDEFRIVTEKFSHKERQTMSVAYELALSQTDTDGGASVRDQEYPDQLELDYKIDGDSWDPNTHGSLAAPMVRSNERPRKGRKPKSAPPSCVGVRSGAAEVDDDEVEEGSLSGIPEATLESMRLTQAKRTGTRRAPSVVSGVSTWDDDDDGAVRSRVGDLQ